jgi:putative flippase GtrA
MNQIKRELNRFLFAGLCAVFSDLLIYYILLKSLNSDLAKGISFLVGTIVAFIINKYWTFEKPDKSVKEVLQFGILYSTTLGLNVMTNKIMLSYTSIVFLSFFVATGVSTILNFVGQKFWVFKK